MSYPINREIFRLAIPNILSNISVPLLSAVDTALMGKLSIEHLGAVGLGSMIFNFIYWNFGFLRMGTTGITAQEFGKRNDDATRLILLRSLFIALFISAVLMALYVPLCRSSLYLMNVSEAQTPLVTTYFSIRIWAAPATLTLYVFMGWFFGMQNAVFPLIITIIINLLNLVLSYTFVIYFKWDISGVALGTVIAQYTGVVLAFGFLFYKYRYICTSKWNDLKGTISEWLKVLKVNSFLFVRTVCLTFAFAIFYAESSSAGAIVLATNVVLLQFLNWISYGIDGFAFASESLVGRYYGAKDQGKMKAVINLSFIWGLVLAIFYSLLFFFFDSEIIKIFSDNLKVHEAAAGQKVWMVLLPLMAFSCYIWDGIYIGLTEVKMMMMSMIICLFLYLLIIYKNAHGQPEIVWLALLFFLFARGILQTAIWGLKIKREINKVTD